MSCYVLNKVEAGVVEEVLRTSYQFIMYYDGYQEKAQEFVHGLGELLQNT